MSEAKEEAFKDRANGKRQVTRKYNEAMELMKTSGNADKIKEEIEAFNEQLELFKTAHEHYRDKLVTDEDLDRADEYLNEVLTKENMLMDAYGRYMKVTEPSDTRPLDVPEQTDGGKTVETKEHEIQHQKPPGSPARSIVSVRSKRSNRSILSVAARRAALIAEEEALREKEAIEKQMLELQQKAKRLEMKTQLAKLEAEEAVLAEETSIDDVIDEEPKHDRITTWLKSIQEPANTGPREQGTKGLVDTRLDPTAQEFRLPDHVFQSAIETRMLNLLETIHMPKTEIVCFDGDPIKYWAFIRSFDNNVDRYNIDEHAKLAILLQYCKGKAYNVISGCSAMTFGGYARAKTLLRERFGNKYVICSSWVEKVANGGQVNLDMLQEFADELRCFKETMHAMESLGEVNQAALAQITQRLPAFLQNRWRSKVVDIREQQRNPQLEELVRFVELAAKESNDPVFGYPSKQSKPKDQRARSFNVTANLSPSSSEKKCVVCGSSSCGTLFKCSQFLKMTPEKRLEVAKDNRLCFNCLKKGHSSQECRSESTCTANGCQLKHTKFLHTARTTSNSEQQNEGENQQWEDSDQRQEVRNVQANCNHVSRTNDLPRVALPIVEVKVSADGRDPVTAYALLDSGSTSTFCSADLTARIGSEGKRATLCLTTLEKEDSYVDGSIHQLIVTDREGKNRVRLNNVFTRSRLPISDSCMPVVNDITKWPHLKGINIAAHSMSKKIELLIGQDVPEALMPLEVRGLDSQESAPYATRTVLGWTLNGPLGDKGSHGATVGFASSTCHLEEQLQQFWKVEGVKLGSEAKGLSIEDRRALDIMKTSVRKDDDHYEVAVPLQDNACLPDNRHLADKRLQHLKKRLLGDPELGRAYKIQMEELISKGYAEEVPEGHQQGEHGLVWYIPHHAVINHKKAKLRIVFDCAAQHRDISLNKQALQGPDLANKLIGVLMRFREHNIAMTADIQAMFHQVKVPVKQRDLLRFLWWKGGDYSQTPGIYRMTVHLFGGTWSPSVCSFALQQTAIDNRDNFPPETIDALLNDFYVDDFLKSVETFDEAIKLRESLTQLLRAGGFYLCKWLSNERQVLQTVPEADRSSGARTINGQALPVDRALGVTWDVETDRFTFAIGNAVRPATRRGMLGIVCSLYDPFGFVTPFTIRGKKLVQDLARMKYGWDTPLPETILHEWTDWIEELKDISHFEVARCIQPSEFKTSQTELHHFADASMMAYGAVSYIRMVDRNGQTHSSLLYSRSRIAPLKQMSIPRLELAAATLAVQQDEMLKRELSIEIHNSYFWTDSTIVLAYINNSSKRFHTYVANRLATIHEGSVPEQWKHVASAENPADDITRGLTVRELRDSARWRKGPEFLQQRQLVQKQPPDVHCLEDDPEVKWKAETYAVESDKCSLDTFFERHSCWYKLKRSTAWLLRFKQYLISKKNGDMMPTDTQLSLTELQHAENAIVAYLQRLSYKEEITVLQDFKMDGEMDRTRARDRNSMMKRRSCLYRLDPFLDKDQILRVGGRIRRASICEEIKHPIILPKRAHITELVVRHHHEKCGHQGRGRTMQELRTCGYWVVSASSAVRKVVSGCTICKKLYGELQTQKMADLPEERMAMSAPFTFCGIDAFGPFHIKEGRKEIKRYAVLFTCMASRAIHIEVVAQMTTDSFINALRRMIALRGPIKAIRSDQGTNFIGAKNELMKEAAIDEKRVKEFLTRENCDVVEFRFNPPSASHMGGAWERQIRSVRRVLSALMMEFGQQLTDEALRTVMSEATAIVNGRPLAVETVQNTLEPLTPNHLLTHKSKVILPPPGTFVKEDVYLRKYWKRVQFITEQFWKRWKVEYLQSLQSRQKWVHKSRNLQIGDIVILKDENAPRNQWPLGRIVETTESSDGLVRKVKLRLGEKNLDEKGRPSGKPTILERPVHKLVCILPLNSD